MTEKENIEWLDGNLSRINEKVERSVGNWLSLNLNNKIGMIKSKVEKTLNREVDGLLKATKGIITPFDGTVDLFAACSESRSEIRHTGTLAHFLTMKDNEKLLRKFINKFCNTRVNSKAKLKLSPEFKLDNARFDFFIQIEDGNKKQSIIIEAKIDSKENEYVEDEVVTREKQLGKYTKIINNHKDMFGSYELVFLTLDEQDNKLDNVTYIIWDDILVFMQIFILNELKKNVMGQRKAELSFMQMWIGSFLEYVYKYPNYPELLVSLNRSKELRLKDIENWREYALRVNKGLK